MSVSTWPLNIKSNKFSVLTSSTNIDTGFSVRSDLYYFELLETGFGWKLVSALFGGHAYFFKETRQ